MTTIALMLLLQAEPRARDVAFDERRVIDVNLRVADGERHAACVVTFPEDSIEAIVASWNEADISLERRRDRLFVKLLRKVEGDLHVIGASGTLYRLYVKPVDTGADAAINVLRPAPRARERMTSLDLVRAMRRAEAPEWASVRESGDVIGESAGARYTCRYVYEATHYLGYVVEVANLHADSQQLDLSRFVAKDLVLVGAREMTVPGRGSTLLYLVFWR